MRTAKKIKYLIIILFLLLIPVVNIQAYVKSGYKVVSASNVKINILSAATKYSSINSYSQWSYSGSPIRFVRSAASPSITFGMNNIDNGNYGVTYHNSSSVSNVVFYKAFINASLSQQKETVVHEIGHCLGLDHTQKANNSKSVMRELGFNGKAYPLSDDKNGINAIY